MRAIRLFASLTFAIAAASAQAADPDAVIRQTLKSLQPDLPVEAIAESAMPGLYQIQLSGGRLLYASPDGRYILQGDLYRVVDGKATNLTEQHASQATGEVIAKVSLDDMVVFPAKGEKKAHITVFTDTDCGYCQKLHSEVPELNRLGVEVRYMAFPRQGKGSHGYNTLVSVWCAEDRQQAMNLAKARKELPQASCDNPVMAQYELGNQIGVNGTPAIVLGNGQLVPGYRPAPDLAKVAIAAMPK